MNKTGVYYLILLNCEGSRAGELRVVGESIWMNPFGYLPGEIFFYLPLFIAMSCLLGTCTLVWTGLCYVFSHQLTLVQKWIGVIFFLGCLQSLFFVGFYYNVNLTGSISYLLLISAQIFSTLQGTLFRAVVILLANGYGVTS